MNKPSIFANWILVKLNITGRSDIYKLVEKKVIFIKYLNSFDKIKNSSIVAGLASKEM
jgi:hypothetical protein